MNKVELTSKINSALLELSNYIGERFPADSDKLVTYADMHSVGEAVSTAAETIEEALFDFAKEP